MILNEDFFDDQNIEPELDSTDDIAPSVLQNTEEWFMDMNSNIREELFTDDNTLLNKLMK